MTTNTIFHGLNLDSLPDSWTAEVELNNGEEISIWWTAWPMSKNSIRRVISVSSDYPRFQIKDSSTYKFMR